MNGLVVKATIQLHFTSEYVRTHANVSDKTIVEAFIHYLNETRMRDWIDEIMLLDVEHISKRVPKTKAIVMQNKVNDRLEYKKKIDKRRRGK